jgi:phosphoglycolate phosphatase
MKKTAFFDLDGTLTDPKEGITKCIQYALEKMDVDVPANDELTWCIGPPLLHSFELLLGKDRAWSAVNLYRERFSDIGWQENLLYPGVRKTLEQLSRAGWRLFVATSKPHIYARKIIRHFQLSSYFETVYGAELDGTRSDKSELLQYAISDSQAKGILTMIGDRKHDIIGGLANQMTVIGVTYGYGSLQELHQAGATRIVNYPTELLPLLNLIADGQ